MKPKLIFSVLTVALLILSCTDEPSSKFQYQLEMLKGEWCEAPGIGYRETWSKQGNGLIGAGFMHAGNTFSQTEELSIINHDSTLIYRATVPTQNEGKSISFDLEHFTDTSLIFVNTKHDFPNIIAYYFLNDTLLKIKVESLTDTSENFTLTLTKTPKP